MRARKRRLLMMSYFYPPVAGVASRRTTGLVEHLVRLGWEVGVVRPSNPVVGMVDNTRIPDGVLTLDVDPWEPRSWKIRHGLLFPDEWSFWSRAAGRAAKKWSWANDADAVLVSAPPFSLLNEGISVASQLGVPFVADLRDPWTLNRLFRARGLSARRIRSNEAAVFQQASLVVLNTVEALEAYSSLYPDAASRIKQIPNGYDQVAAEAPGAPGAALQVVHAGSLDSCRVPALRAYLDALSALGSEVPCPITTSYGLVSHEAESIISHSGHSARMRREGYVASQAISEVLPFADVLLLLGHSVGTDLHVPAKIYDYIGARRPILAIANHGGIGRILAETEAGQMVPPSEIGVLAKSVRLLVESKAKGRLQPINLNSSSLRYSRAAEADELNRLLLSVVERRAS